MGKLLCQCAWRKNKNKKQNITGPYHNSCSYVVVVEIVPVLLMMWLVWGEGDKYLRCAL